MARCPECRGLSLIKRTALECWRETLAEPTHPHAFQNNGRPYAERYVRQNIARLERDRDLTCFHCRGTGEIEEVA